MRRARANRYRNLTWGLVAVLVIPPFARPLFSGAGVIGPVIFIVLVSRSLLETHRSRLFRAVLASAMAAVAIRAAGGSAHFFRGPASLAIGLHVLAALGFVLVLIELLRSVLERGPVDADKLYAAVSAYLVLGLAFASFYEAIAIWQPAAFAGARASDGDALVYFSLVTLSTVGYGDIVPALPQTRVLAVSEAIAGQFYLAILLARLVGRHLSQSSDSSGMTLDADSARTQDAQPSSPREAP
jgi:voltage-gated potassium channel